MSASFKAKLKSNERAWSAVKTASSLYAVRSFRRGCRGNRNRLELRGSCLIRGLKVDIHGDDNLVVIGDRSWLRSVRITIRGSSNRIVLGENVQFGGPGHLWVEDNQGELSIGSDCTLEVGVTLAVLEGCALTLGEDCMIAGDVEIRTGDSHVSTLFRRSRRAKHA